MHKSLVLLLVTAVGLAFLAGCGPPANYGENDIVTITGKYVDAQGNPLANKEVAIWILDLAGVSLDNWWYPDPEDFELTDENGNFEIQRLGKAYLWGNGSAKYIIITNFDSLSGPVTAIGFFVINQNTDLPEARLWQGNVDHTVDVDSANATFTWDAADAAAHEPIDQYTFSSQKVWWDLWTEKDVETGFQLPTWMFQNYCLGWRVEARVIRDNDEDIDWTYLSEVKSGINILPNNTHQVLSKNMPAYADAEMTTSYEKLTNDAWHELEDFGSLNPSLVIIDLGESLTVNALAVYGLTVTYAQPANKMFDNWEVYVSDDASDWGTAVGTSMQESGYIRFEFTETTGRYVKFSANDGANIQINWIREISAFGPLTE